MTCNISEFTIRNLHGERTIRIPIRDNRVVVVGANGLGKTTVVNLLYLVLSRQWERALDYDFSDITLTLDGQSITLPRRVIDLPSADRSTILGSLRQVLPRSLYARISDLPPRLLNDLIQSRGDRTKMYPIATSLGLPPSVAEFLLHGIPKSRATFDEAALKEADSFLRQALDSSQVLYLPTYRRIEKDLNTIFPNLEEQVQQFDRRRSLEARESDRSYIELVEFGMEDVERTFFRTRNELTETGRAELNNLAGSYLRDVIRGEGTTYEARLFNELDEETVTRILNRVEEKTLNDFDKAKLRVVIEKIKSTPPPRVTEEDRYIAYFFSKLVAAHRALVEKEDPITRFVKVCNRYLKQKQVVYDDRTNRIGVDLDSGRPIALRDLSSGEKQIVSLFSHLYLQREGQVLVLIDEPELSLSVDWQKLLLPDILATGRCRFLTAVTHSPFIFDNELDGYALDLADCIERTE